MKDLPVLLITANVGSLFELWNTIAQRWFDTISASVSRLAPAFLAFHFQEAGGKDPKVSMKQIKIFSEIMLQLPAFQMYKLSVGYLDTECDDMEKYTALGSFYFVHQLLQDRVSLWDFQRKEYSTLDGRQVTMSNSGSDTRFEKIKFPPEMSPEKCWCRKGFLHTRWRIDDQPMNFVNIHMFHDTSNLVALESSPSIYADCRRQALEFTLSHLEDFDSVPTFIFGDFNFRTDVRAAVQDLTKSLRPKSSTEDHRVSFSDDLDRNVLLVGKKEFHHKDHETVFTSEPQWLIKHDAELRPFNDRLVELEVNFPPSYPCQEESDVVRYLPTRCPAWCDRVLMNAEARELLSEGARYNMIGKRTSMGDHKKTASELKTRRKEGCGSDRDRSSSDNKLMLNSYISLIYGKHNRTEGSFNSVQPVYLNFVLKTDADSSNSEEQNGEETCDDYVPQQLLPLRDDCLLTT